MFIHHPHAAYSVDSRGYYTDANPRALEMTGLSLERDATGRTSPRSSIPTTCSSCWTVSTAPCPASRRCSRHASCASTARSSTSGAPPSRSMVGGEVIGVHGITEDVTADKQLMRQLQEANAAKTLFLATVSHEVRTPLAALVGATDLLMESELDPEPEHFAHIGAPLRPTPGAPGGRHLGVLRAGGQPGDGASSTVRRARGDRGHRGLGGPPRREPPAPHLLRGGRLGPGDLGR